MESLITFIARQAQLKLLIFNPWPTYVKYDDDEQNKQRIRTALADTECEIFFRPITEEEYRRLKPAEYEAKAFKLRQRLAESEAAEEESKHATTKQVSEEAKNEQAQRKADEAASVQREANQLASPQEQLVAKQEALVESNKQRSKES